MSDTLQKELDTYKRILPSLAASEGKFALIFGEELKGTFETYADALAAGYRVAGLKPFLVKRIATNEVVSYFTRDLDGVCRI